MTQQIELSPDEINLASLSIFIRNEAHDLFRILRREAPVHWNQPTEQVPNGFWSITKYADVVHISRNPTLFISGQGITMNAPADPNQRVDGRMMITSDPPDHVRLRRLVNKGFTPRAVRAMDGHIREITTEILDGISAKGECDFVTDVAAQLPLAVICGLMGVEREHWPLMFELTNKFLGAQDPEYQVAGEGTEAGTQEAAQATILEGAMRMHAHFTQMLADRRIQPREDLVSTLVESEIDGQKLSDMDLLQFCLLLIVAGNETTRNAISGGMLALAEHPEQKQRLLDDPSLLDSAVEEMLRWTSPVAHMARVATADTEIRGQQIKAGDRLVMWYPSVNRDEDVFPDPDRFDVARQPNEHLAFGIGEHFCLGAGFARLEIKVIFEELLRRFPDIEVTGPAERLRSNFIAGIKHLPVAYTPGG